MLLTVAFLLQFCPGICANVFHTFKLALVRVFWLQTQTRKLVLTDCETWRDSCALPHCLSQAMLKANWKSQRRTCRQCPTPPMAPIPLLAAMRKFPHELCGAFLGVGMEMVRVFGMVVLMAIVGAGDVVSLVRPAACAPGVTDGAGPFSSLLAIMTTSMERDQRISNAIGCVTCSVPCGMAGSSVALKRMPCGE